LCKKATVILLAETFKCFTVYITEIKNIFLKSQGPTVLTNKRNFKSFLFKEKYTDTECSTAWPVDLSANLRTQEKI